MVEAVTGVTSVVEAMHANITRPAWLFGPAPEGRTGGVTGLVYGHVRAVTRLVGATLDVALAPLGTLLGDRVAWSERDAVIAALNVVIGDYLVTTGNPLALPMELRHDGRPLDPGAPRLEGRRVLVLVHGAGMGVRQWTRRGHDHGAALARDLGVLPVYLQYNSGLHVSQNGRAFAELLERLVASWPGGPPDLDLVGFSMGGLVSRSALHHGAAAGHAWIGRVKNLVCLGTPHHGAPLERGGNWIDVLLGLSAYSAPLARLGQIRSAGVTDLRHGSLLDEDWQGRDRFARGPERPRRVPLPEGVRCHAIAATRSLDPKVDGGDGMVLLSSALGRHPDPERHLAFPDDRQWVARGLGHLDLLDHPGVYEQIRSWLAAP